MSRVVVARAAAAAIVVIGAAAALIARGASTAQAPVHPSGPNVPVAAAVFGPYVARIEAQGRVGVPSGGQLKLAFASTGIVARLDARVGDVVAAGQPLAELDSSAATNDVAQARSDALAAAANYGGGRVAGDILAAAQARLRAARERFHALDAGLGTTQSDRAAAEAALRQSEAKLAADRRELERATQLFAGGVLARKDVDAARLQVAFDRTDVLANSVKAGSAASSVGAALAQARADVAQSESDVQSARAQQTVSAAQAASAQARSASAALALARTTLRAPARGVISAILKQPGEGTDPTQPAIVISPLASSDVTLAVPVSDVQAVQPGDAVTVRLLRAGQSGNGRVRSVVRSVDPATQTATVVVTGVPRTAVDGDAVDATIVVGRRFGVVIPTSAIVADPGSGKLLVFVRRTTADGSEQFAAREITVDIGDDTRTLIRAGLRAGERIAVQGAFDLLAPSGGG